MTCKHYSNGLCDAHFGGCKCPFDNNQQLDCEDYLTETNCECDDAINLDFECQFCGNFTTVRVSPKKLHMYRSGLANIQDVFPELTADEREVILSGICNKCWNEMFHDEED